jgi:hypothetical protein
MYIRHRGPPKKRRNEGCRGWLQDGGCRMKVAGVMVAEVKVAVVVAGVAVGWFKGWTRSVTDQVRGV